MRLRQSFARLGLGCALAVGGAAGAAAQHPRPAGVVAVRHAAPGRPAVPGLAGAAARPSYARHALAGAGAGAALGLAVAAYSVRYNTGCADCFPGQGGVFVLGAVAGSAAGFLGGTVVYAIRRANRAAATPR